MKTAFLIGRIIVGAYFLYNGVSQFLHLGMMESAAAAKGVPLTPLAIPLAGLLLLVAGFSFLSGWKPAVGIAAIVLFLVPVSFSMHPFWREAGAQRMAGTVNFTKNMALLGAALMFAAIPRPWAASIAAGRRETEVPREPIPHRRTAAG